MWNMSGAAKLSGWDNQGISMTEKPYELSSFLGNKMIKQASKPASSKPLPRHDSHLDDLLAQLAEAEARSKKPH
jgi:hypothetical protein